jgi:uncharacterized membrane protein
MLRRLAALTFLILIAAMTLLAQNDTPTERNDSPTMNRPGKGILDVIVSDQDGKPLKGAKVSVPGYQSITGQGGTARFGLLPGRYAVLIAKDGYRGKRVNAGVTPGTTTTTRVTLQKLPSKK